MMRKFESAALDFRHDKAMVRTPMKGLKKILSVASVTTRLFFRGGAGWGLLFLVSAVAGFMFSVASGDGVLADELRIRIKYAIYVSTILLNVALVYFACVSLRKDIDERRFHNITAAPVSRGAIWLGKLLGTLVIGTIAYFAMSLTVAACCFGLIARCQSKSDVESLKDNFYLTYYLHKPDLTKLDKEIKKEYAARRRELEKREKEEKEKKKHLPKECQEGHCHHHHGDEWKARKYLLFDVRREKQMIFPGKSGKWPFDWDPDSLKGEYAILKFKFYTSQPRKKLNGTWSVSDGKRTWSAPFSGYPTVEHKLRIPVAEIPKTKRLVLTFDNKSRAYLFFPAYNDGIQILSGHRGVFSNYILLYIFSLAHMATLVALALTFSSLFSYSVAVFASVMMYLTAAFSDMFANVLNDLSFQDQTFQTIAAQKVLEFGLWLTEGAKPLPVNGLFSDGISIPVASFLSTYGFSFFAYLAIVALLGLYALRVKEIDKIPQA